MSFSGNSSSSSNISNLVMTLIFIGLIYGGQTQDTTAVNLNPGQETARPSSTADVPNEVSTQSPEAKPVVTAGSSMSPSPAGVSKNMTTVSGVTTRSIQAKSSIPENDQYYTSKQLSLSTTPATVQLTTVLPRVSTGQNRGIVTTTSIETVTSDAKDIDEQKATSAPVDADITSHLTEEQKGTTPLPEIHITSRHSEKESTPALELPQVEITSQPTEREASTPVRPGIDITLTTSEKESVLAPISPDFDLQHRERAASTSVRPEIDFTSITSEKESTPIVPKIVITSQPAEREASTPVPPEIDITSATSKKESTPVVLEIVTTSQPTEREASTPVRPEIDITSTTSEKESTPAPVVPEIVITSQPTEREASTTVRPEIDITSTTSEKESTPAPVVPEIVITSQPTEREASTTVRPEIDITSTTSEKESTPAPVVPEIVITSQPTEREASTTVRPEIDITSTTSEKESTPAPVVPEIVITSQPSERKDTLTTLPVDDLTSRPTDRKETTSPFSEIDITSEQTVREIDVTSQPSDKEAITTVIVGVTEKTTHAFPDVEITTQAIDESTSTPVPLDLTTQAVEQKDRTSTLPETDTTSQLIVPVDKIGTSVSASKTTEKPISHVQTSETPEDTTVYLHSADSTTTSVASTTPSETTQAAITPEGEIETTVILTTTKEELIVSTQSTADVEIKTTEVEIASTTQSVLPVETSTIDIQSEQPESTPASTTSIPISTEKIVLIDMTSKSKTERETDAATAVSFTTEDVVTSQTPIPDIVTSEFKAGTTEPTTEQQEATTVGVTPSYTSASRTTLRPSVVVTSDEILESTPSETVKVETSYESTVATSSEKSAIELTTEKPSQTDVPSIIDSKYKIVFNGECSVINTNANAKDQFKENLKSKLVELLLIDAERVIIDEVECGSLISFVTITNTTASDVDSKLGHAVCDDRLSVVLGNDTYTAGNLAIISSPLPPITKPELSCVIPAVVPTKPTVPTTTTEASPPRRKQDDETGLSRSDIIGIIVGSVIGGSFIIMAICYCIYKCHHRRNTQSFSLGKTPSSNVKLQDYTLTKMDRAHPVYQDDRIMAWNEDETAENEMVLAVQQSDTLPRNNHYAKNPTKASEKHLPGHSSANHHRGSNDNLVHAGNRSAQAGIDNPSFAADDSIVGRDGTSTDNLLSPNANNVQPKAKPEGHTSF